MMFLSVMSTDSDIGPHPVKTMRNGGVDSPDRAPVPVGKIEGNGLGGVMCIYLLPAGFTGAGYFGREVWVDVCKTSWMKNPPAEKSE
eukprot:748210-Hanusia_phi.AAC.6